MSEKDPRSNADHGTDCGCFDYRRLKAERDQLARERQDVLNCINLYGDETLHDALDAIGWLPREAGKR